MFFFSGTNPFVVFAEASILMNCKIQTLCVKTNVCVNFSPPEMMNEDCLKILYYHNEDFTMCQRVMEIRMNDGNQDSSKQMEPDFLVIKVPGKNDNTNFDYVDFLTRMIGMHGQGVGHMKNNVYYQSIICTFCLFSSIRPYDRNHV